MDGRLRWIAAGLSVWFAGCLPGKTRLDEHVFHDESGLRLKVVRYHENLPLHYTGEIFVVQCQSENTVAFESHATQDAGWRMLGRGGAIGTQKAEEVVPDLEDRYRVMDDRILVWLGTVFKVSFDGCGRFATWDPTALPETMIDPVEKPDYCAPKGTGDCRHYDFLGDRAPVFGPIHVDPEGRVAFDVRSPSFRDVGSLHVTSTDFGRTWSIDTTSN
jgi:hypothetical protein